MKVLGIDCSTSVIGWCILDDEKYISCGFLNLTKTKDIYEKLQIFIDFIKNLPIKPDIVEFEAALMMFKTRSSMASVISLLQSWNGMCRSVVYNNLGIKSKTINPMTARKLCGLVIPRKSDTKEFVLAHIKSLGIIPNEMWQLNRNGKNQRTNFDIADATIIALAAFRELELNNA